MLAQHPQQLMRAAVQIGGRHHRSEREAAVVLSRLGSGRGRVLSAVTADPGHGRSPGRSTAEAGAGAGCRQVDTDSKACTSRLYEPPQSRRRTGRAPERARRFEGQRGPTQRGPIQRGPIQRGPS